MSFKSREERNEKLIEALAEMIRENLLDDDDILAIINICIRANNRTIAAGEEEIMKLAVEKNMTKAEIDEIYRKKYEEEQRNNDGRKQYRDGGTVNECRAEDENHF